MKTVNQAVLVISYWNGQIVLRLKNGAPRFSCFGRKDFLAVEPPPQADLSFLFRPGAPESREDDLAITRSLTPIRRGPPRQSRSNRILELC